jgi:hypothetical protein
MFLTPYLERPGPYLLRNVRDGSVLADRLEIELPAGVLRRSRTERDHRIQLDPLAQTSNSPA